MTFVNHLMSPSTAAYPDVLLAWRCVRCDQWVPEAGRRPNCLSAAELEVATHQMMERTGGYGQGRR